MPYCTVPSLIRSGMLSDLAESRMLSFTAAVLMSTSHAGTRPLPSLVGTRRSDTTASSDVASKLRTASCSYGGKNEITRLIVCVASVVWSVEKTRCPVSAAFSAVSSVSMSRISPIRITSGACRSTWRNAALNDSVSFPTSRCEMLARLSRCKNSIGSSIVMMLTRRFVLMWLIIAASAVDFPDPVTPVTSTSPRGRRPSSSSTVGRFRSRIVLTSYGMARKANATVPRCWYTLVRNRPTPGTPMAKSASLCSANSFTWRGVMICSASDFNSSGLSGDASSAISSPFTRIVAGRPTLSSRSDALRWTMWVMAALKLKVACPAWGASGMGVHPEEELSELDGLGVLHEHLPHHARDLGLDFIHDLHSFDDADDLARRDPAPRLDVRLGAGLRGRVVRPDHGRLDLDQMRRRRRRGRRNRRAGSRHRGRPVRRRQDHVLAALIGRVPGLAHPHRRPGPEQTPADLDRPQLGRLSQDLHQLGDDVEVHGSQSYTSSKRSVRPSLNSSGPVAAR